MKQYWNKNKQHFHLCICLSVTVEELHSYFVKICTWISFALWSHFNNYTTFTRNVSAVYAIKSHEKDNFFKNSMYFFQIFMRCEAEGYCYDYWPNMGNHDLFHGRSIGEKVVKHLCRPLKYKCHYFFFDRFEMKTIIWLTKIEIYSFPEHLRLIVCVTSYIIFLAQF